MSIREQILTAVHGKLKTLDSVLPQNVFRSRNVPVSKTQLPSITISPQFDATEQTISDIAMHTLTLSLLIRASGEIPDQAADMAVSETHRTMLSDVTLSGLTYGITPKDVSWEYSDSDPTLCAVTMDYDVEYQTRLGDLDAR